MEENLYVEGSTSLYILNLKLYLLGIAYELQSVVEFVGENLNNGTFNVYLKNDQK